MSSKLVTILLFGLLSLLVACGDDEDESLVSNKTEKMDNSTSLPVPCVAWGTSVSDVERYMGSNNGWITNKSSTPVSFHYNRDFLIRSFWGDYMVMTYEFEADSLISSQALLYNSSLEIETSIQF